MPRKRMIHPSIWESKQFYTCTERQRLLFIGIFSLSDDYGKIDGEPLLLRSKIFVNDDISNNDIEKDIQILHQKKLIICYEVDGEKFIKCTKWDTHQKVSHPTDSKIPDPIEHEIANSRIIPESFPKNSKNLPKTSPQCSVVESSVVKDSVVESSILTQLIVDSEILSKILKTPGTDYWIATAVKENPNCDFKHVIKKVELDLIADFPDRKFPNGTQLKKKLGSWINREFDNKGSKNGSSKGNSKKLGFEKAVKDKKWNDGSGGKDE